MNSRQFTSYTKVFMYSLANAVTFMYLGKILANHRNKRFYKDSDQLMPKLTAQGFSKIDRPTLGKLTATLQLAFRRKPTAITFVARGQNEVLGIFDVDGDGAYQYAPFMTVHMSVLEHASPHLYFDNKANNSRTRLNFPEYISNAELVIYEGYMSEKFDLYAPQGYRLDSLVVAAPDVLDAIDRCNMGADIEIIGNQLYMIFPNYIRLQDRLDELLANAAELAKAFEDNLSRYIDDRARGEHHQVDPAGRWLIRK